MLKNWLKVAFQLLFRNRIYSLINIVGLGIGLACCLLILLHVRFELSYEQQFTNAERIYRISKEIFPVDGARLRVPASNNGPVARTLVEDFQEVEAAGRIYGGGNSLKVGESIFDEAAVRFTDQGIVQVFDFEWLAGDAGQALADPGAIVLTESLARKIFGTADVLGADLEVPGAFALRVTGVIRDIASNSHLSLTGMISMPTLRQMMGAENFQRQFDENWNSNTDFYTYFLLAPQADATDLEAKLPAFVNRHITEGASESLAMRLMNIRAIHLYSNRDEEWKTPGSMANVYSFSAIALAILVIACINFMSIATSRSAQRSREIGARLAVGATRKQLIAQFLGESALTALLAMILALVLVEVLLPAFSSFVGNPLAFDLLSDSDLLLALLLLTVFVAFFSGSYPAFYLSAMKPVAVLKGEMGQGKSSLWLRNAMVMVQFSIAITLVVSTAVIYLQRQYAVNIDMGFEKDSIVVLPAPTPQGYSTDWQAFSQALLAEPAIESVTTSHYLPFGFNDNQIPLKRRGTAIETRIQYMQVGYDFFETYKIETIAGRVFSRARGTDNLVMPTAENPQGRVSFVLNESAAAALGINPQAFTEETLEINGMPIAGTVLGIVRDTNFESIRRDVRPMIFLHVPTEAGRVLQRYPSAAIRIDSSATSEALSQIDAVWQSFYPNRPNNRYFLDDDFRALYETEARQGQLLSWFATLAIVIACFGLFGLASFNAERRTKEIGVRKVMGGSVWNIVLLLTNDFSRLVLLSNVIAWPLAYVAMERWLENFAYRIDLTPLIFIGSGLIALCIAWVTVGGTAAKAASRKPVLALRYE